MNLLLQESCCRGIVDDLIVNGTKMADRIISLRRSQSFPNPNKVNEEMAVQIFFYTYIIYCYFYIYKYKKIHERNVNSLPQTAKESQIDLLLGDGIETVHKIHLKRSRTLKSSTTALKHNSILINDHNICSLLFICPYFI